MVRVSFTGLPQLKSINTNKSEKHQNPFNAAANNNTLTRDVFQSHVQQEVQASQNPMKQKALAFTALVQDKLGAYKEKAVSLRDSLAARVNDLVSKVGLSFKSLQPQKAQQNSFSSLITNNPFLSATFKSSQAERQQRVNELKQKPVQELKNMLQQHA